MGTRDLQDHCALPFCELLHYQSALSHAGEPAPKGENPPPRWGSLTPSSKGEGLRGYEGIAGHSECFGQAPAFRPIPLGEVVGLLRRLRFVGLCSAVVRSVLFSIGHSAELERCGAPEG
jgi:hypothetical protein